LHLRTLRPALAQSVFKIATSGLAYGMMHSTADKDARLQ